MLSSPSVPSLSPLLAGSNVRYAKGLEGLFLKKVLGHQCATAWLINTAFIPHLMRLYEWGITQHRIHPFYTEFFADQIWVAVMEQKATNWFMTYPTPWARQRPGVSDHRQQEVESLGALDTFKHAKSEL